MPMMPILESSVHGHIAVMFGCTPNDIGLVTVGRGLVDRLELSVELFDPGRAGSGHGRGLIAEGLAVIEAGAAVFAQVAPGNAGSLRAFLSCGFVPIAAETLLGRTTN